MNNKDSNGFSGLGIAPKLLDTIDRLKFTEPTPIQQKSIPIGIAGKDLIGIAQTGTGKTLAFGIPLIQQLAQHGGRGLVILPTRELAIQVDEAIKTLGQAFRLYSTVLIGGASMFKQIRSLKKNPHIIIATPGRLIDHLEQKTINLSEVKVLVLDEADRMLDMGFAPQINKILAVLPYKRQTMLYSATMPKEIITIASQHMNHPVQVETDRSGSTVKNITQQVFFVDKERKNQLLEHAISKIQGPVLVFTRTKYTAQRLSKLVNMMGHSSTDIHSNRSLFQRKEALEGFKTGRYQILIATDIAARGIDVSNIELVINYDLPTQIEDYIHRIGRTGRAGKNGQAISFASRDQRILVKKIERLTKTALTPMIVPDVLPPKRSMPHTRPEARPAKPHNSFRRFDKFRKQR